MIRSAIVSAFAGLLMWVCPPVFADTLSVAVAANLQYTFDELRAGFKAETGHDLRATYNSSGKLTAQIMNGAPFDAFLSADMAYPERLYKEGFAVAAPKPYAYGTLVLWTMKPVALSAWQMLLSSAAIDKIALANPQTAPSGRKYVPRSAPPIGTAMRAQYVVSCSLIHGNFTLT